MSEFKTVYDLAEEVGTYVVQLLAENAKLRELMYERAHVYAIQNMTEDELRVTATNVMAENAKLRELAESCLRESMRRCSTCPYELTAECEGCVLHENESRLREMGVVE